jgi:HlyD family secretion protein
MKIRFPFKNPDKQVKRIWRTLLRRMRSLREKFVRLDGKVRIVIGIGVVLLAVLVVQIIPRSVRVASVPAMKGEFVIDLNTRGEVDALNSTSVSVPGGMRRRMSLQIVDMAPEGIIVKKGDFLFQLDKSESQQRVDEQSDNLANARAELESEKANIASNMAQIQSDLEREKYSHEQAKLNLKMMEYEAEIKKQEYDLLMKKAEVALAQAEEKIKSQLIIDKATLMKAELKVRQAEAEVREAKTALDALSVTSPIDGLVVYQEIWSGNGMKKIQVGDSPWWGMPIIKIPDLAVMQAKTTVNEVDISGVRPGQNSVVTVDALEGKTYYGKITRVASLARRERKTNAKVFDVEVTVDSTDGRLRPGMTCQCRLITGRIPDAVYVPIQSVFQKEDTTVVYVMGGHGPKKRKVRVGARSSNYVVVEKGLDPEEKVCLRDPTVALEAIGKEGSQAPQEQTPKKPQGQSRQIMIIR